MKTKKPELRNEWLKPELTEEWQRKGAVGPRQSRFFRKLAVGTRGGQRHITVESPLCRTRVDFGTSEHAQQTILTPTPWAIIGRAYVDAQPGHYGIRPEGSSVEGGTESRR